MTPRPLERRSEARVEFLAEQDGPSEADLKVELGKWFAGDPHIQRAYLAAVGFQPTDERSVALCIVSARPDMTVVKGVSAIFERIFRSDMHLDVLFITDDQEDDLRRVCRPFYQAVQ